jgi:hypothetical protein
MTTFTGIIHRDYVSAFLATAAAAARSLIQTRISTRKEAQLNAWSRSAIEQRRGTRKERLQTNIFRHSYGHVALGTVAACDHADDVKPARRMARMPT